MASFSLSNIGSTSVTFNVSGITYKTTENEDGTTETSNYVVVRFFVRLADDEDNETIDYVEVLYGATSITMTFDGLEPLTEYAANVQIYTEDPNIDGAWIGTQYFTSGERATSSLGTLMELPLLSEDFQLFSWVDWPNSYAALYSGGYTANFEKECWNDIVDTLEAALHEAGFKWQNDYTTVSGAQITSSYGALYAEMFNSVRYNIDRLTLLGWDWAKEPTFFGYVGREDFNGVSTSGSAADEVYYTYFLELARRLNVLINVLKGEVVEYISGNEQISVYYTERVRQGHSAPLAYDKILSLGDYDALIRAGRSGVIRPQGATLITRDTGNILSGRAGIVRGTVRASTESNAVINPGWSAPVKGEAAATGRGSAVIWSAIPKFITETVSAAAEGSGIIRPGVNLLLKALAEAVAAGAAIVQADSSGIIKSNTQITAADAISIYAQPSRTIAAETEISTVDTFTPRPDISAPLKGTAQVSGESVAIIRPDVPGWIFEIGTVKATETVFVLPDAGRRIQTDSIVKAAGQSGARPGGGIQLIVDEKAEAIGNAGILTPTSTLLELDGYSAATGAAGIRSPIGERIETTATADVMGNAAIASHSGGRIKGQGTASASGTLAYETIWEPPVWVAPGELHIIQSWVAGTLLSAEGSAAASGSAAFESAWEVPEWTAPGELHITQSWVAGTLLSGTGAAKDAVAVIAFDNAWEVPVYVAPGELYITQAWDESDLNDNILEVV